MVGLGSTYKTPIPKENHSNLNSNNSSNFSTYNQQSSNQTIISQNLITKILSEFDAKKPLIWSASNEKTARDLFIQLGKNVAQLMGVLGLNLSLDKSRNLIILFAFLFDNDPTIRNNNLAYLLAHDLKPCDQRIKSQINRIYSNFDVYDAKNNKPIVKAEANNFNFIASNNNIDTNNNNLYDSMPINNNQLISSNNQFNYDSSYYNYNTNQNQNSFQYFPNSSNNFTNNYSVLPSTSTGSNPLKSQQLNQLKTFHFLLILFTSMSSLDDFIRSMSDDSQNVFSCQKLVLNMIHRICEDSSVRNKIVLSVSELS